MLLNSENVRVLWLFRWTPALLCLLFLSVFLTRWTYAEDKTFLSVAPTVVEKFEYDLSWLGIKAGTASFEVIGDSNMVIRSAADSVDWISKFYKVQDRAYSELGDDGFPRHFETWLQQGKYRSHKETFFEKKQIRYIDHRRGRKLQKKTEEIYYDVLSGFQSLRTMELVPGDSIFLNIFDSGKMEKVEVKVLRRENLDIASRSVKTIVVQPALTTEGLFRHTGKILIWLTDDARRVPLKIQTRVVVGSVTALLVKERFGKK